MIQRTPYADALTYGLMIAGFLLLIGPLLVVIAGASQSVVQVNSIPFSFLPQGEFLTNAQTAWQRANLGNALLNSMIMASWSRSARWPFRPLPPLPSCSSARR